jgi:hypothetical protein
MIGVMDHQIELGELNSGSGTSLEAARPLSLLQLGQHSSRSGSPGRRWRRLFFRQTSDLGALSCDPLSALGGAPGTALGHQREPFRQRRVYWINPLGVKGLGERKNVASNPAVANAVFQPIGKRERHLPIRPEKLRSRRNRKERPHHAHDSAARATNTRSQA